MHASWEIDDNFDDHTNFLVSFLFVCFFFYGRYRFEIQWGGLTYVIQAQRSDYSLW